MSRVTFDIHNVSCKALKKLPEPQPLEGSYFCGRFLGMLGNIDLAEKDCIAPRVVRIYHCPPASEQVA